MSTPSPIPSFDLVIIGAGPAGCTTALTLADSGLKVALVDKASLPAAKICGDALSGTVMNVLKRLPGDCYPDFLKIFPKTPSRGIRFIAPGGKMLDLPFPLEKDDTKPAPGYICRREVFDDYLQKKVRERTNAGIIENFPVREISKDHESFIIKSEKGEIRCRMVAGADGTHSVVGRILAGHSLNHERYCLGARAYFRGVRDLHPEHFIELHFLKELLPGYFWIFPMEDGLVNAGLGIMYRKLKAGQDSLAARFTEVIRSHPVLSKRFEGAEMVSKIEAHGLTLGPDPKAISGEGFLLAGDAASLIDPFSGEGIGNAMVSGEIAGKIIAEAFKNNDFSATFLKKYDERIRHRLGRELRTSRAVQKLVSVPGLFDLVVKKAGRSRDLKEMLIKMYTDQDVRDLLMSPGFYLKVLLA
ncbi:MAG: NAD(P)/FAD-dependent oxidoreductase [Bacteroidetes bacterium]|nr:NAD(P)/FAD-dependent oxidoreductase [Bacteroidota bacterium]